MKVTWRKSTYSGGQDECLEIADGLPAHSPVPVRDSKHPDGPHLLFPAPAWSAFIASVKAARS
ncbi:toxin [Streptomyces sp. NRRL F-5755]|uniref:DUF397 domain-containing protein n=1 Tax=Streptomyces sp. NRRL F-5755 TaxID=1519475 RepID=UPI0006AE58A3|nr:DUF397 domain-containing protein [Streptomyces sp. NRRL F-5755]KOT87086.1 toxin [Streptomyces sp. NRRL F-5755]